MHILMLFLKSHVCGLLGGSVKNGGEWMWKLEPTREHLHTSQNGQCGYLAAAPHDWPPLTVERVWAPTAVTLIRMTVGKLDSSSQQLSIFFLRSLCSPLTPLFWTRLLNGIGLSSAVEIESPSFILLTSCFHIRSSFGDLDRCLVSSLGESHVCLGKASRALAGSLCNHPRHQVPFDLDGTACQRPGPTKSPLTQQGLHEICVNKVKRQHFASLCEWTGAGLSQRKLWR